ncbi:diadenylate cyclase CdaA [Domibacillus mangrovi]|uniref:Diadenylate cyclase n=1 Tax=Domibacillus mangrovi TaxID=1714354 RepID=A0A1Q5P0E7_9BACI|nr:diadenylate cyclase CdaA [Domibacillus mangrovi]OKL35739.1 TIGR00159 family protein [Domibacillus mangrovi]
MPYITYFQDFTFIDYLSNAIDILLVWYVVYKLLMVIRGTKAVQLLKGIFVIVIVRAVSGLFGLSTLSWIMEQALTWGFLAVIIIFQPEVRRALEQLGRGRFFSRSAIQEDEEQRKIIEALLKSVRYMSKRRIGALISIEKETGMNDYIETGIPMQSVITSELLINVFIPNTPLHDGAVIIQKDQIAAAACYLPLSENPFISKELGTRHRAALGISEVTDSLTIIVSEETGAISVTRNGDLYRDLTEEEFEGILEHQLLSGIEKNETSNRWAWKGRRSNG